MLIKINLRRVKENRIRDKGLNLGDFVGKEGIGVGLVMVLMGVS
ncbi:hypothetical protein [Staphylococcus epidermidis]|nr:hypothetical protein [Staphylococcus epidermidis]